MYSFGPLLARGDKHRAVIESVDKETRHAYQKAHDCKENQQLNRMHQDIAASVANGVALDYGCSSVGFSRVVRYHYCEDPDYQ